VGAKRKSYRQDHLTTRVTQISLIFFPVVTLVFAAVARGQLVAEIEGFILFVLLSAGVMFFGSDMIAAVELDEDSIQAHPILWFTRTLRWRDVREVNLLTLHSPIGTSRAGARLFTRNGRRPITLSARLSDWDDLVAELRMRVPRVTTTQ
jgi:hypothetical protein